MAVGLILKYHRSDRWSRPNGQRGSASCVMAVGQNIELKKREEINETEGEEFCLVIVYASLGVPSTVCLCLCISLLYFLILHFLYFV